MREQRSILIAAIALTLGYMWLQGAFLSRGPSSSSVAAAESQSTAAARQSATQRPTATVAPPGLAIATFAGGCFWCTEADFDKVPGVQATTSGYTGGHIQRPTYEEVSAGDTGHTEAVEVLFDPKVVTYETLLDHYWHNVDPFTRGAQFCDVGDQYRPAIFVRGPAQRAAAEASKVRMQQRFQKRIVVPIVDAPVFYRAEAFHQDYYKRHSAQYRFYRFGCRRDARLQEIWEEAGQ